MRFQTTHPHPTTHKKQATGEALPQKQLNQFTISFSRIQIESRKGFKPYHPLSRFPTRSWRQTKTLRTFPTCVKPHAGVAAHTLCARISAGFGFPRNYGIFRKNTSSHAEKTVPQDTENRHSFPCTARQKQRSGRAENPPAHRVLTLSARYAARRVAYFTRSIMSSRTLAASALPCVAFITAPTIAPAA